MMAEDEEAENEEDEEEEEEALPIFQAAARGDVNEVARLLDAKPQLLEARDVNRYYATLLVVAAREGHVGVVRLLLERGAEVNAAAIFGETALHYAAGGGHEQMVNVLLSSGADSSMKSHHGSTALMWAPCWAPWRRHVGVLKQLLKHVHGPLLNDTDEEGRTALWSTCHYGWVEGLRVLLLAGADHTIGNNHGETPRQIAEEEGHTDCVVLLEVSGTRVEVGLVRV
jgi:serine/threonine-protein phosphatase 6 regulatory ankyrin repeat subunit B